MSVAAMTIAHTIVPKSDQLNADDLIAGPITITLTKPRVTSDEQPVSLHYEGDEGKPYKPCKSMRRVLVRVWGPDANLYVGRSLTLYNDPNVAFGGQKVGGIRISHMSHIDSDVTIPLTVTRAQRKPYTVRPLRQDRPRQDRPAPPPPATSTLPLTERAEAFLQRVKAASTPEKINAVWAASEALRADLEAKEPEVHVEVVQAWEKRRDEIEAGGTEEPA